MTTSFTRTRTQIAQRVLGKVIKIGAQTAISADADTVYEALDLRLKEMQERHVLAQGDERPGDVFSDGQHCERECRGWRYPVPDQDDVHERVE